MSGLRSQRLNTMTCVSERSGIASSLRFCTHQSAPAMADATTMRTKYLFFALSSMIRSTIASPSLGRRRGRLRERGHGGAEARLRVDQEVRRRDDVIALAQSGEHLEVAFRARPEHDRARL